MLSSQDIPPPVTNTAYGLPLPDDHDSAPTPLSEVDDRFHVQKPIDREDLPVVEHPNGSEGWLPAEDLPVNPPSPKTIATPAAGTPITIPATTPTTYQSFAAASPGVGGSVDESGASSLARGSSRRSAHTASDGRMIAGSAFVNGAGTTGPYSTAANDMGGDLAVRHEEANATLTHKQKSKIAKNEAKHGRRLSKIIKQEAKTEKKSLSIAIDELANLQKHQKNAIKSEARVQASHGKLLTAFKKTEANYLNAKMQFEAAKGDMDSEANTLQVLRANAREATQKVQDKSAEVDALRRTLAVDEREREVKLGQLKNRRSSFWG